MEKCDLTFVKTKILDTNRSIQMSLALSKTISETSHFHNKDVVTYKMLGYVQKKHI